MSAEDVLREAVDAVNRHDAAAFAALYASDAVARDPQYAEPLRGRDAIRKDIEDFFVSFPDLQATMSHVMSRGDTAACELEFRGTNAGPLVTPAGALPATNRGVSLTGSRFIRVDERGAIAECRRYFDMAALMEQLGLSGMEDSEAVA